MRDKFGGLVTLLAGPAALSNGPCHQNASYLSHVDLESSAVLLSPSANNVLGCTISGDQVSAIYNMDSESVRSSRRPSAVYDDEGWQRRRSAMYRRSSNFSQYVGQRGLLKVPLADAV